MIDTSDIPPHRTGLPLRLSRCRRKGTSSLLLIGLCLGVAFLVAMLYYLFGRPAAHPGEAPILAKVMRRDFVATVLDQGEIRSMENMKFVSQVQAKYSSDTRVIKLIAEGTHVSGGELLVQLDSAKLEAAFAQQQITVNRAQAGVMRSRAALASKREEKVEYLEGIFKREVQKANNRIHQASEDLRRAQQRYQHTRKLYKRGFATQIQMDSDRFAVESFTQQLELERATKSVLLTHTKRKREIQFDAEIAAAQTTLENDRKSLALEQQKLSELQQQIEYCEIRVPAGVSGQVVYAHHFSKREESEYIVKVGAAAREQRVLLLIPNLEKLAVEATIDESQIASVQVGMPALVQIDALNNRPPLSGRVTRVNPYAVPDGWVGGGIKRYGVQIKILKPPPGLRPGMNASVTIQVDHQPNVLQIPLQAIYNRLGASYCLVKESDNYVTREITVGGINHHHAWIQAGLSEEEQVVLNPRKYRHWLDLPEKEDSPQQILQLLSDDLPRRQ